MLSKAMYFCDSKDAFSNKVLDFLGVQKNYLPCQYLFSGEIIPSLNVSVRGKKVFLLVKALDHPNEDFMKLFLMVSSLRNGKAEKIVVVMTAMGYLSNDFSVKRSPLAAASMIKLIEAVGADHLIFLDMHDEAWRGYGKIKKDSIKMGSLFFLDIRERFSGERIVFIPLSKADEDRADYLTSKMTGAKSAVFINGTLSSPVKGKKFVLVGDTVANPESLYDLVKFLKRRGAKEVHLYLSYISSSYFGLTSLFSSFNDFPLDSLTLIDLLSSTIGSPSISFPIRRVKAYDYFGRALREIDSGESLGDFHDKF